MSIPDVRVEVAFDSQPGDAVQAWTDVTPYVDLSAGISITRGRGDEYGQVQPSTLALTVDNSDGRFTAGLSSSPYYPNVKIGKQIRIFGTQYGNFITGDSATFEGGTTGDWTHLNATISSSTTRSWQGSHSMLIASTAANPSAYLSIPADTLSQYVTYTVSAYVWVAVGSQAVNIQAVSNVTSLTSSATTTTGAWQRIQASFTVTDSSAAVLISVFAVGGGSGQQSWVDAVQLEQATSASTFTTTAATGARFTGHVDEWPVEWSPIAAYSRASITATDRLKRLGQIGGFSNVVAEEVLHDGPIAYYQMGEGGDSTTAGDSSGRSSAIMSIAQVGTGGSLTFGANTGPGTDGLSCPSFAPASSSNGKYLTAAPRVDPLAAYSMRAAFLTSSATTQTIIRAVGQNGTYLEVRVTSAGKVQVAVGDASGGEVTGTSVSSFNDGQTHDAVVVAEVTSGTRLYVDGTDVSGLVAASMYAALSALYVGGIPSGALFAGAISHVAVFDSALSASRVLEQRTATTTGFSGESSDARIARYARWAGVGTSDLDLESGDTTSVAFVDTTGLAPLRAMQDIAATEGGVLFVAGDGRLTFHARSHRYNAAPAASVDEIGIDDTFVVNDQQLVNDVTAGRDGGITYRAVASDSVADYGTYRTELSLLTTSDNEVLDAANWNANIRSMPQPRLPQLTIDLLTNTDVRSAAVALEIGSLVTLTGLPAQAPDSVSSLFIEGWTETISTQAWTLVCNTSPSGQSSVWALDSAVFSTLGQTTTLAY